MIIHFTKEEKEKLKETLAVVVEDLRSIFNTADSDKISYEFEVLENEYNNYSLVINKKSMYLKLHYSDWYMNLDKVRQNGKVKMCVITDYNLVFLFLQKYEEIRKNIENKARENQTNKEHGMRRIQEIYNQYTKEATIEVEMPDTINQSSIEVIQEDGKNVGKVNIGPLSLRILASPSVKIIERNTDVKVKKK